MDLVRILRNDRSVFPVVDARVDPYPGHFHPIGVMAHHTAGASLHVKGLQDGYRFPGPLCNIGIDLDGTRYVITDGRANDSGRGSSIVLDRVERDLPPQGDARDLALVDNTDGNPWFYDIEVVNNGVGQPYPQVQLDSLVATCAALCQAHLWSENRVIHHREWTRRKIDMSWRGNLRGRVALLLQEDAMTPQQEAKLDRALQLLEELRAGKMSDRDVADDDRRIRIALRKVLGHFKLPNDVKQDGV